MSSMMMSHQQQRSSSNNMNGGASNGGINGYSNSSTNTNNNGIKSINSNGTLHTPKSHRITNATTANNHNPSSTSSNTNTNTNSSSSSSSSTFALKSKSNKPISYETFAPRSQSQRNRLAQLQALTSGPILTSTSSKTSTTGTDAVSDAASNESLALFANAMIPEQTEDQPQSSTTTIPSTNTTNNDDDDDLITKTLAQTTKTSNHISQILTKTSTLTTTLTQTINLTQNLTKKHSNLLLQSSELSYNAEKLQSEYDILLSHANDIGRPLSHYDDIDRLGLLVGVLFKNGVVVKGISRVKVDDDEEFQNVLNCINDAILFFESRIDEHHNNNSHIQNQHENDDSESGSMEYYKRSVTLLEASLDLLKEAIVNRIDNTTTQIIQSLQQQQQQQQQSTTKNGDDTKPNTLKDKLTSKTSGATGSTTGSTIIQGDVLEASLIYTRFHGISVRSCHLMNMIYKRLDSVMIPDPNISRSRRKKNQQQHAQQQHAQQQQQGNNMNHSMNSMKNKGKVEGYICPYTELWTLCRNSYIANRTTLLKLSIRNHLDFLKAKHGLIGMTRLASVFLMRLCTIETSLYLDFFGKEEQEEDGDNKEDEDKDEEEKNDEEKKEGENSLNGTSEKKKKKEKKVAFKSSSKKPKNRDAATLASQVMSKDGTYYDTEFQSFLDNLCDNLHRTIRRGLVSVLDLDTLCQIVSVLREERSLANSSPTTMAAARSIGRVIVDAQERLIFCANSALGKEVIRFRATPIDLDYPDKLRKWREQQQKQQEEESSMSSQNGSTSNSIGNVGEDANDKALKLQMQVYESWFPPIRSVLKVLSKIFRVVEPNVFEDIALNSIQSCSRSLKEGSMYIEKKSGVLHSDLFLVMNLLILREQLSPFDMQLRSVERQLDFSDAGKAVSRFIANRNRRLFSMTSKNALVTLLSEGLSTREKSIDSKRDLEDALRSACNDFIEHTSVSLAGPVLSFVEQCKGINNSTGSTAAVGVSLSSQSFMTGEYVMNVMTRALDRLEPAIGEINTQMVLYMDNAATRSILLKPVVRKITRILEEGRAFISEGAVVDDSGRWTEDSKNEVLKVMDDFEKMIKSASPRL